MFIIFNCGNINKFYLNKVLFIYAWIYKIRNHGKIIFIDLYDKTGILQGILIKNKKFKFFKYLKINTCLLIKGYLLLRNFFNINFFNNSGKYELIIYNIFIINFSKKLPFNINDYYISEFLKLTNRFLNLRSFYMQNNLKFRYNFIKYLRNFFNKEYFIDIETPFLSKSSPEGARDFIIPSRLNLCKFFALPQSPQLLKQILMISNFDRYYQIVKCFRDEDSRKNRQFEFTQLDFELTFCNEYDILDFLIILIFFLFKFFIKFFVINKILFINYSKSIKYFFSDKPDIRFKIKYFNFYKFSNLNFINNYKIKNFICLNINNGYTLFGCNFKNYKFFIKNLLINSFNYLFYYDKYSKFYITYNNLNLINKNNILFEIKCKFNFKLNDYFLIFINNNYEIFDMILFIIKFISFSKFGFLNNLINFYFIPLWVNNFSLFEYKLKNYDYLHNPFSSPINFDKIYLDLNPIKCNSKSYDFIINGNEIGGGSIRNDKFYIQKRIFFIIKINNFNYKFFLNALSFSPPIHGGLAFGLDRFLMILMGLKNIKDIIAFPKTQSGYCLLTRSPITINNLLLNYLNIKCN